MIVPYDTSIPALTVSLTPTYRIGSTGRRYLTKRWAYRNAAVRAFRHANPCECESDTGYTCPSHTEEWEAREELVISRLARWLEWRDARVAAVLMLAGSP